nr:hypothetical protein [Oceanimonas doudoroffii]
MLKKDDVHTNNEDIVELINTDLEKLKILDGLQRTYTLLDIKDDPKLEDYTLRVDLYVNINDIGIMYRMLTLNTGQTPMSLRQQVEMLYSNYADSNFGDINIIRQVDDESVKSINDFKYSDLVDGYNSYLESNETPLDRYSLLEMIKVIESIANAEVTKADFPHFVKIYYSFVNTINKKSNFWVWPDKTEIPDHLTIEGTPFGKNIYRVFNRSQSLTGFGAAISQLITNKSIKKIEDIVELYDELTIDNSDLLLLNKVIDDIKKEAKKIGDSQRLFFKFLFRSLFDPESEEYLNFKKSIERASRRTLANI